MNRPRFIAALALGVVAFGLTLTASEPPGPGLDPDAVSYVLAATTLVRSGTLLAPTYDWDSEAETVPLAHFPPGFPVTIAVGHALGLPPVQSARIVVALSALVTIATVVWLVGDAVGLGAGLLAGVLLMVTPAMVDTHLAILSEPLFLACLALTVLAMTRERDRPLVYGVFAAAACMVRYAGVAAPAAA
ncbi:MAG: glycosyltransferase family 39 protein, partial [Gemmatimonadota bacterium]|nr:glycosyltransferase family 39 protein [Gemmatimonadota bacterium]